MCWWKSLSVCVGVVVFSLCLTGSAGAEAILRPDHGAKGKDTNKIPLSTRAGTDERSWSYLLIERRPEVDLPALENKKKVSDPPIHWDSKHAKKLKVKAPKLPHKTPHFLSPPQTPHQAPLVTAQVDVPMAASSMVTTSSVPAPSALWAGLGMFAAMGAWKCFARRPMGMQ
jgi:hypothetical protein